MVDQSRESEIQILTVQKDIEHLKYIIDERIDDTKHIHNRIDQHLKTDAEFHEDVRKKITYKFNALDDRIRKLERWKWVIWGGLIATGLLLGKITTVTGVGNLFL